MSNDEVEKAIELCWDNLEKRENSGAKQKRSLYASDVRGSFISIRLSSGIYTHLRNGNH